MAERLLAAVTAGGELRTDTIPWAGGVKKDSPGEAARQLQRRLLVHADEVHTESGAHAKRLESWARWARRAGLRGRRMAPGRARRELADALSMLNERFHGKGKLPWEEVVP
jgi:hypothetical protein